MGRRVYVRVEVGEAVQEACLTLQPEHTQLRALVGTMLGEAEAQRSWAVEASPDGLDWTTVQEGLSLEALVVDFGHRYFLFTSRDAGRAKQLRRTRSRTPLPTDAGAPRRCPSLNAPAPRQWQRRAQMLHFVLLALAGALPAAAGVWAFARYGGLGASARTASQPPPPPPSLPPPPPPTTPPPPAPAGSKVSPDLSAVLQSYAATRGWEEAVHAALRELHRIQERLPGERRKTVEVASARWLADSLARPGAT
eukprot:Hpha_TRINITY_DN23858_c0_g1::TRINITY_DN23858_c0_g1_i1::g.109922::m.109922